MQDFSKFALLVSRCVGRFFEQPEGSREGQDLVGFWGLGFRGLGV